MVAKSESPVEFYGASAIPVYRASGPSFWWWPSTVGKPTKSMGQYFNSYVKILEASSLLGHDRWNIGAVLVETSAHWGRAMTVEDVWSTHKIGAEITDKRRFPKSYGYPQIIHSTGMFHYKPSILGYPHFRTLREVVGDFHDLWFYDPLSTKR